MAIVKPLERRVIRSASDDGAVPCRGRLGCRRPSRARARGARSGPRSPSSLRSSSSNESSNETLTTRSVPSALAADAPPSPASAAAGSSPTGREADLALVVDLVDADLELLAERQDVLDGVDPPAAAELGDVHEAVAPGKDVDERTELGDVHHPTRVDLAQLGLGRIDDGEDGRLGLLHPPALDRADRDDALGAVVVDVDVGAGLGLDRVDHLALGADHLADLVDRDHGSS